MSAGPSAITEIRIKEVHNEDLLYNTAHNRPNVQEGGEFSSWASFSTQRMVGTWNELPEGVVAPDKIAILKRPLDKYFEKYQRFTVIKWADGLAETDIMG